QAGSCELLTNGDFEAGLSGWNQANSANIALSADADSGANAVHIQNTEIYQLNLPAQAGGNYELTLRYKIINYGHEWAGIDFIDTNGNEIGNGVGKRMGNNASFSDFSVSGIAPSGTSTIRVWIWGGNGTSFVVDNVSLESDTCTEPTITPTAETPDIDLEIEYVSVTMDPIPACLEQGEPIPPLGLKVFIRNNGSQAAGSFLVEFNGATQTVSSLAGNAQTSVFFTSYLSNVTVTADSATQVAETNETNNTFTQMVPIPTPPAPCPTPVVPTEVPPTGGSGQLETVAVTQVSNQWTPASLQNSYADPVIACALTHDNNTMPTVVRLRNVTGSSFEVRLQNPGDGTAPAADDVTCLVVESGAHTLPDGRKIEAQKYLSSQLDWAGSWVGEQQSYLQGYGQPVVLGQVMSFNDTDWSVFWSRGSARQEPADSNVLYTGMHVGADSNRTRTPETIGFIVIEAGNGSLNGIAYEAALGADSVFGYRNVPHVYTFNQPFSSVPAGAVASQMGMDGGDGSWAIFKRSDALTATSMGVMVDEDQLGDSERGHTDEQLGYFVFEQPIVWTGDSTPITPVPPTPIPPTAVPPTSIPPTEVPPTSIPPTEVPPTSIPPTSVPPTPTPVACGGLSWEAEDGVLDPNGRMTLVANGEAIGGSGSINGSLVEADRADYCVTIPADGDYIVQARVKAPTDGSNSMYWTVDGAPSTGMIWHMALSSGITTQSVSNGGRVLGNNPAHVLELVEGTTYTISFYLREPGAELYSFELIEAPDNPEPPDGNFDAYDFNEIDYSNVGLTNGIPTYTNEIRVTSRSQSAIEAAIEDAYESGQPTKIILQAGDYNISGDLRIDHSNIILAGENNGCGATRLIFGSSSSGSDRDSGIIVGKSGLKPWEWDSTDLSINGSFNSTIITVDNPNLFSNGDYILLRQNHNNQLNRIEWKKDYDRQDDLDGKYDWVKDTAGQMNKIIGINGNQLTLEGALNMEYTTGLDARIYKVEGMVSGVGIENLTIERQSHVSGKKYEDASGNISFSYATESWIRGVQSINSVKAHITLYRSYKNEIRGNYLYASFNNGGGGHGYGVVLKNQTSDTLIENNIAKLLRHSYIVQQGGNGNIFGYNYSTDTYGYTDGPTDLGEIYPDLSTHGSFAHGNLFEGNQAQSAKVDNVHASNVWNFFFRNRLEQDIQNFTPANRQILLDNEKGYQTPHLWIQENQYGNTFLANELSFPGADSRTNTNGFNGRVRYNYTECNFSYETYVNGCTETQDTTTHSGTYDHFDSATYWDPATGVTDFPHSVYYDGPPAFWGNSAWPPFGPDVVGPNTESSQIIPAKLRFVNGSEANDYCYMGN
ncbi:MAG: CARDB domain-containing protein, partial [Chloroflexota bacterium]